MTRIAMLGLGAMGRRMARRLMEAGHEVTVWNRTPTPALELQARGARRADTPRAAAEGAEIVWAMVFDDAASRFVWLDVDAGAAAAVAPNAIAVESSTLSPAWIRELHDDLAARRVAFVDAPVAGSRPQAEAGQLIFMLGGDDKVVDRLRPTLATLGSAAHHVGPVGSGSCLKLAVNALFATQVAAVAEQLNLLRRLGVDPARALDSLRTMPVVSPAAAGAAALMLREDYAPQAPVDLIAKDLGIAVDTGQRCDAPMPLTAAALARFRAAQAAGWGHENLVAVAKLLK